MNFCSNDLMVPSHGVKSNLCDDTMNQFHHFSGDRGNLGALHYFMHPVKKLSGSKRWATSGIYHELLSPPRGHRWNCSQGFHCPEKFPHVSNWLPTTTTHQYTWSCMLEGHMRCLMTVLWPERCSIIIRKRKSCSRCIGECEQNREFAHWHQSPWHRRYWVLLRAGADCIWVSTSDRRFTTVSWCCRRASEKTLWKQLANHKEAQPRPAVSSAPLWAYY